MYSLTPGYRIPALQRGLSPCETLLTRVNAGVGSAVLASAMISPPPLWTFGAIGAAGALLNLAPGPARWPGGRPSATGTYVNALCPRP